MKILLDECLPLKLRHSLPKHECHTVQFAGLKGSSNGQLLDQAQQLGDQVLLTVDQNIYSQQKMAGRMISVLAIRSRTNKLEDLLPLLPVVELGLQHIRTGEFLLVP